MNLALVGNGNLGTVARWSLPQGSSRTEVASPFDQVTIGSRPAATPTLLPTVTAGEAEPTEHRSIGRSLMMGLLVAGSLMGMTGCASMAGNGPDSAYSLAQNVTGREAKNGFDSADFLDKYATPLGGGLFNDSSLDKDAKLQPLDALDQMLDGHSIYYLNKADGKPQQVRSWAELRGIADMVREGLSRSESLPNP